MNRLIFLTFIFSISSYALTPMCFRFECYTTCNEKEGKLKFFYSCSKNEKAAVADIAEACKNDIPKNGAEYLITKRYDTDLVHRDNEQVDIKKFNGTCELVRNPLQSPACQCEDKKTAEISDAKVPNKINDIPKITTIFNNKNQNAKPIKAGIKPAE